MLRVLLPPNLPAAAARNAVAVKVEFTPADMADPKLQPALAWLTREARGAAGSPLFLQFTRAQLRDLVGLVEDQPVFFWVHRPAGPLRWDDGLVCGASEYLGEPDAPAAPAPAPSAPVAHPRRAPASPSEPPVVDGSEHFLAVTLPSREHPAYDDLLALLKASGFILEPSNRRWWLRDRHKTLNFLAAHWTALRERFGAGFTPNFERNTAAILRAGVTCSAGEAAGGFEVTLSLDAGPVPEEAVRAALGAGRSYAEDSGKLVLLPSATIERFAEARRRLAGDPAANISPRCTVRLPLAAIPAAEALIEPLVPGFRPPAAWAARSEALRNLSKLPPAPLPPELDACLRPYQRLGAAWLWHLYRNELGGILADEMGLGKTLQALAVLCALRSADPRGGPSLVVCPASLMENWRRESARFAPGLRTLVHHGGERSDSAGALAAVDLVITSYGTLVRDSALFGSIEFACVIGDEAQHIKNRRTQHAQALRALRSRGRFLLTGTPVENSLDDLHSLFAFLMPSYLPVPPAGARGEERAWHDAQLRSRAAPYLLRRTKGAVAPELPPKIEQILYCELPPSQAARYREWQQRGDRELDALAASGASDGRLRLAALTQLLRLRQVCCDPRLVDKSPPPADFASAKLEAFRELLEEAADDGHRLLVFSQFTSLLALLREELAAQEIPCCYLDGSMNARARQAEIDRFHRSSEVPVFLLSLKAGGTGLNLTGADVVVHFDPWWNPAVEAQATDRAHRIGQRRTVTSYKLICAGTVEEKVLQLQDDKRALLADIFEASDAAAARLSLDDLRSLLR